MATTPESARPTRVFVSYAHDRGIDGHRDRALKLTQSLRLRGVEAVIDQFLEHDPPFWPRWMIDQVKAADYVLCLASPGYKERFDNNGDPSIAARVKVVVAWVMQPTVEYRDQPNASL